MRAREDLGARPTRLFWGTVVVALQLAGCSKPDGNGGSHEPWLQSLGGNLQTMSYRDDGSVLLGGSMGTQAVLVAELDAGGTSLKRALRLSVADVRFAQGAAAVLAAPFDQSLVASYADEHGYLTLLDSAGSVVWSTRFASSTINNIYLTGDARVIAVGRRTVPFMLTYLQRGLVAVIDFSDGSVVSHWTYKPFDDELQSEEMSADLWGAVQPVTGGLIVAGTVKREHPTSRYHRGLLVALDDSMGVTWARSYERREPAARYDTISVHIAGVADEYLLVADARGFRGSARTLLWRVAPDGSLVWGRRVEPYSSSPSDLAVAADGTAIIGGIYASADYAPGGSPFDGFFAAVDGTGALSWTSTFGGRDGADGVGAAVGVGPNGEMVGAMQSESLVPYASMIVDLAHVSEDSCAWTHADDAHSFRSEDTLAEEIYVEAAHLEIDTSAVDFAPASIFVTQADIVLSPLCFWAGDAADGPAR